MTTTSLVLTLLGPDHPGLVEAVSNTVAEYGASWEESRMARLAGRFAGILLVTVDEDRAADLEKALLALEGRGLRLVVERATADDEGAFRSLRLDLVGNDRPGIIRDISRALAERGVNVVDLETEVVAAPMAGGMLFTLGAELHSPADVAVDDLRGRLEELATDLMVEIHLLDEGPGGD